LGPDGGLVVGAVGRVGTGETERRGEEVEAQHDQTEMRDRRCSTVQIGIEVVSSSRFLLDV